MEFRTDIATGLIVLSVIISTANWFGILRWLFFKKCFSAIPILGGAFGMLGILLAPPTHALSSIKVFFWLPIFWDYGSLPLFALSLLLKQKRKKEDHEHDRSC